MEDLSKITAKNIVALRTAMKMTQFELGEKLRYSDKAISKWERGEAIPDAYVLKEMSVLFGVSVDYLLTPHTERHPLRSSTRRNNRLVISLISFFSVWAVAILAFIICLGLRIPEWRIFVYAVPVSLIVLLVFNSMWGTRLRNFFLIAALVASIFVAAYFALLPRHFWPLFVLIAPAELIVCLAFLLKKK